MVGRRITPTLVALICLVVWVAACSNSDAGVEHVNTQNADQNSNCEPTPPDTLGPFYKAGAPVRSSVGDGYILTGAALSAEDCSPVANALIEFWLAGPDGEYQDDLRASILSDADGTYRFECPYPPPYSGRPPHIHIRVTAPGFNELVTQHYPRLNQDIAEFDLVLVPSTVTGGTSGEQASGRSVE